jgi:hypothetical protein
VARRTQAPRDIASFLRTAFETVGKRAGNAKINRQELDQHSAIFQIAGWFPTLASIWNIFYSFVL